MKKILILAAGLVLMATSVLAAEVSKPVYINDSAEVYHQTENGGWETVPVKVYVLIGKKKYYDDLTFIEIGRDGQTVEAFVMEKGLPGDPNIATRREREKFIRALKKSRILMTMAEEGDLRHQRSTGRFLNFDLDVLPKGIDGKPRLRVKMLNIETKDKLTVYLDEEQITNLATLLEKAPETIAEAKKARSKVKPTKSN